VSLQYELEVEDSFNHISYETWQYIIDSIPQITILKHNHKDIQFLFKIMYWSGLRPAEAIKLQKKDFHTKTRKIDLFETKTKHYDSAVIPMTFRDELAAWLETKPQGDLFPGLQYKTLYRWMKKLGKICDVIAWTTPRSVTKEMTVCHGPRKSIGKNMLAGVHVGPKGVQYNSLIVSKVLRHSNPLTTVKHYLNVDDMAVRKVY
jgi:integrase